MFPPLVGDSIIDWLISNPSSIGIVEVPKTYELLGLEEGGLIIVEQGLDATALSVVRLSVSLLIVLYKQEMVRSSK